MEFKHISVLLNECIESLAIKPDGIYADGTAGGAGHSSEIAKRLKNGKLYAFDRDPDAVKIASERLKDYNAKVIESNFSEMKEKLNERSVSGVDGILLDLGVSSYQLDTAHRGFSYHKEAPLDMRMSKSGISAADVVNTFTEKELSDIFFRFGEEKFSQRIAARIVSARQQSPINTTGELVQIVKNAMPAGAKDGGSHPAKRTFQAIRIEVNKELNVIAPAVRSAVDLLNGGGRVAIITFHSLEDRIVKQEFVKYSKGCTCPKDFPVCVCGKKPKLNLITHKPILPSERELEENRRSHSAKLRVAEKI